MADITCPAGSTRHVDLDSNAAWCEDAAGVKTAAVLSGPPNILALAGLAAAALILASCFIAPPKKKRGRRR